jgi:hypothetical protein
VYDEVVDLDGEVDNGVGKSLVVEDDAFRGEKRTGDAWWSGISLKGGRGGEVDEAYLYTRFVDARHDVTPQLWDI